MEQPWFVMLDRDGTVIEDRHYLSDPDQIKLLPNVPRGLKRLVEAGYHLILITNQSGVGRGLFDEAAVDLVHERLRATLLGHGIELDGIFFCPHRPEDDCNCRKPRPGLFEQARAALPLVPGRTCMIGDKAADIDFGHAVGGKSLLVLTGYGPLEAEAAEMADAVVADLDAAADWVLEHCR